MRRLCIVGGSGCKASLLAISNTKKSFVSSIISVFDSGGSTGIIRRESGTYAIGDLRDNLLSVSKNSVLKEIMSQRIDVGGQKHSIGNLVMLSAMKRYGEEYLDIMHSLLDINKNIRIIPVIDDVNYKGNLVIKSDRGILVGEHNLDLQEGLHVQDLWLDTPVKICNDAKNAIISADYIIFGPGDLYSSILSNVIVPGFTDAIKLSKAKKILICNIMMKENETVGFKTSDFLNVFSRYGINIDIIVWNNKKTEISEITSKYGRLRGFIENDLPKEKTISADLVNDAVPYEHDVPKLRRVMSKILK